MQISSLPREAGTSVGKKADGECKKEIVAVSDLGDQGLGFGPAAARGCTATVCSSPQTSSVLQK